MTTLPLKKWSAEEPKAILDYLHGDTPAHQVKACCYYEYSRASEILRKACREMRRKERERIPSVQKTLRKKLGRRYDPANPEDLLMLLGDNIPVWLQDWRKLQSLICRDYPELPWRELNEAQRKDIVDIFVKARPTPLITDVRVLNAIQVFDRFKQQAKDERGFKKAMVWGSHYPAIVGDDGIKRVVVTLDYKGGKDAMKQMFRRWVHNDANTELFRKYYKKPIHKQNPASSVRYKELLKYLAAWRLYDELGLKEAKEWTRTNRRRKDYHLLPFFGEKLRKTSSGMHYTGPLFKEPRQWKAAIQKAESFLATEIERGSGMT